MYHILCLLDDREQCWKSSTDFSLIFCIVHVCTSLLIVKTVVCYIKTIKRSIFMGGGGVSYIVFAR